MHSIAVLEWLFPPYTCSAFRSVDSCLHSLLCPLTSFLLFPYLPFSKFMTFYLTSRGWALSSLLRSSILQPSLPSSLAPLMCCSLWPCSCFVQFLIISSTSIASIRPTNSLSQDQLLCGLTVGSGVRSHFLAQVGHSGTHRCKVCDWDILKLSRESFCFVWKGKGASSAEIVLQ